MTVETKGEVTSIEADAPASEIRNGWEMPSLPNLTDKVKSDDKASLSAE